MSIRIALDVTPEVVASAGVARYSRELRRELEQRADCEVVSFAIGRRTERPPAGVRTVSVPLRVVHASWRMFGLPRAEQVTGEVDIVHSLDLVPPPTRCPLVVTVHDLVTAELPDLHTSRSALMQERQRNALSRAAAVIAVSRSTAEALATTGVDQERLHVAPNGLTRFASVAEPPVPPGPFVLVVGTLEARKGHDVILRAFARASIDDTRLVFAGPPNSRSGELRALAAALGVADRLIVLGRVDDAVLAGLYRRATLLCLPSLGEGFGFPVLEAMAFGLPVLASDLPAVREVAGEAAVLVPPGDVDALAGALLRLFTDEGLRNGLSKVGPERASAFTWEAAAEATVQAYRAALRRAG